jgi:hypothetical protein
VKKAALSIWSGFGLGLLFACTTPTADDGDSCPIGKHMCDCEDDQTCDAPLVCMSGTCLFVETAETGETGGTGNTETGNTETKGSWVRKATRMRLRSADQGSDRKNVVSIRVARLSWESEIHSSVVCAWAMSPGPNTTLGVPP